VQLNRYGQSSEDTSTDETLATEGVAWFLISPSCLLQSPLGKGRVTAP
jgi:hypothetical protein